ncbi:MAG: hypothetical protein WC107_00430 [Patescibacteria group bacterium]
MKKIFMGVILLSLSSLWFPEPALAAGISVSGGSPKYVGDQFSVSVMASGATFNAFSGTISSSGSLKIVGCNAGDALWVTKPTGAGSFAGALTTATSSFKIATLTVKAASTGSGSISVSGVQLANKGPIVGTNGGSVSFSIQRRPTPPGSITVASSSHPDPTVSYEITTIELSWDKPSGVTGFSYLLDQAAETVPPASATNSSTSITYDNQAIGTYYFHIRALNGDGWGETTHFKVTIKEPDPKIQEQLQKPHDINARKSDPFTNNIKDGTVSGLLISGYTEPNYMANIKLDPSPTLPENKLMSVKAGLDGKFEFLVDFPIKSGFYRLTIQGQDNKLLTPVSDPVIFEVSQAKGGTVTMLTEEDTNPPIIPEKKWYEKINYPILSGILGGIILIIGIGVLVLYFLRRKEMVKLARSIKINN